jgi:hypothetical protein
MRIHVLLLIIVLAIACKNKYFNKAIPLNTMKLIVWDMACADEFILEKQANDTNFKKTRIDTLRTNMYQKVFAIHKISKEEFYTNYIDYEKKPDVFKVLIDSVQNYGARERAKPIKPQLTNTIPY